MKCYEKLRKAVAEDAANRQRIAEKLKTQSEKPKPLERFSMKKKSDE